MHTGLRNRAGQIQIFMEHSCFLINKGRYNDKICIGHSPAQQKKKEFHTDKIATSVNLLYIEQTIDQIPPAHLSRSTDTK